MINEKPDYCLVLDVIKFHERNQHYTKSVGRERINIIKLLQEILHFSIIRLKIKIPYLREKRKTS
jgi:hypothetical protein